MIRRKQFIHVKTNIKKHPRKRPADLNMQAHTTEKRRKNTNTSIDINIYIFISNPISYFSR